MNFKIIQQGQEYYVVPSYGSGKCWVANSEKHAKQILKFIKTPELITNIRKL